jgi:tRNA (guanine-N(7)-)-methyltransferase subunit TRM82
MASPFQCLAARQLSGTASNEWTLFGACGSTLIAQSSGGHTSSWSKQDDPVETPQPQDESEGPPEKKVKLSPPRQQKANFTNLIVSHDGQYLVGVTGEDKCIRVFQTDSQNNLQQLSERSVRVRTCHPQS